MLHDVASAGDTETQVQQGVIIAEIVVHGVVTTKSSTKTDGIRV